jgi:type IV secretory pathway VirJ component
MPLLPRLVRATLSATRMAAVCSLFGASAAIGQQAATSPSAPPSDLPLVELRSSNQAKTLAVFLSGDGGWADIDRQIGQTLAQRGIDVIGFDDRAYLRGGARGPEGTARDVARAATFYMERWGDTRLVLAGYSRGANFLPFVANRMSPALRARLALIAMLGLEERASFKYRFSDLWATRSRVTDTPILPELERLRGTNMLCVYGKDEDESLCRGIDSTLVHPVMRPGKHHFDGDYQALTSLIVARLDAAPRR